MTAYGSPVTTTGWLGLPAPYEFALTGHASHTDLRRLPASVPLPKLPSDPTFDFDARGRFQNPLAGRRRDSSPASTFLDAAIEPGTAGRVDTAAEPMNIFGARTGLESQPHHARTRLQPLDIVQPDYAGVVAGTFDVVGQGTTMSDPR